MRSPLARSPLVGLLALGTLGLVGALAVGGCVQLVALGQPVIGSSDEVGPTPSTAAGVCDDAVSMGAQAYCDVSCAIDPSDGASTCGARVEVDGQSALLDVANLHEVEVVVNACARGDGGWSLTDEAGATLAARGAALEVRGGAGAVLHQVADFVPDGECAERSVVLQDRRLELVQTDRRLCDPTLLGLPARGVDARWRLRWTGGVRAIELCLRTARTARPPA